MVVQETRSKNPIVRCDTTPAQYQGQPQNGQTVYDEPQSGYIPTRRLKQNKKKKREEKKKKKESSNGKVYLIGEVKFEIESI